MRERGRILLPLLVGAASAAAFLPCLGGAFLWWDDRSLLLDRTQWRGFGPDNLAWMFTTFRNGHWQPLAHLSFALNHLLGGLDPFGYHLANLLLHGAAAALFHVALLRLWALSGDPVRGPRGRLAAAAAALLFGVHPLRAETVCWITERREVLASVLLLGALLAWLRGRDPAVPERERSRARLAALALHGASLLASAWGATFPAVLAALEVWPGPSPGERRERLRRLLPFAALALAAAVVAPLAQGAAGALATTGGVPLASRCGVALFGLAFYVGRTLLPLGLSPLHEIPVAGVAGAVLLAAPPVALGAFLLWRARARRPAWIASAAIYVAVLLPVLGFFQSGRQIAAERYSYLACLPLAGLAGAGLRGALRRGGGGAAAAAAAAAAILLALRGIL